MDVTAGFGPLTVLHGITMAVEEGSIAGIFGLNGAGKSVTMKTIAGMVPARSGRSCSTARTSPGCPRRSASRMGMGHVPQGRQVFPQLTVEENLRLGAYTLRRRDKKRYGPALDSVFDRFPILRDRRTPARRHDVRRAAGIAVRGPRADQRAAADPGRRAVRGLSPVAQLELREVLQVVKDSGVTMVLVEQNIAFGLSLVDTANLLQTGVVVHTSAVADLDNDTLATHLGIGKVLAGATGTALRARQGR